MVGVVSKSAGGPLVFAGALLATVVIGVDGPLGDRHQVRSPQCRHAQARFRVNGVVGIELDRTDLEKEICAN